MYVWVPLLKNTIVKLLVMKKGSQQLISCWLLFFISFAPLCIAKEGAKRIIKYMCPILDTYILVSKFIILE